MIDFNKEFKNNFQSGFLTDLTTYRKSISAKIAWKKFRINYRLGDIKESVRNSLGLGSLFRKLSSMDYHS